MQLAALVLGFVAWTGVPHAVRRTVFGARGSSVAVATGVEQSDSAWTQDSTAVHGALERFLTAFENLDFDTFRGFLAPNVTMFFPTAQTPGRFDGRLAVEARFRQVFDEIRRGTPSGPPYQRISVEALHIESLGSGMALVTFEFHSGDHIGRRTIIFRRAPGGWSIVHIHASNILLRAVPKD